MPNQSNRRIITNRQLNFTLCPVDTYHKKEMPYSLPNYAIDGTWNHHQSIILDVFLDKIFKAFYSHYGGPPSSWRTKKVIDVKNTFGGGIINPDSLLILNQEIIKAFSNKQGYDVEGNERQLFEDRHYSEERQYSFEEYFKERLKQNSEFANFLNEANNSLSQFKTDYAFKIDMSDMFNDYPILEKYRYRFKDQLKKVSETKFNMKYKIKYMEEEPEFNEKGRRFKKGVLSDFYYDMEKFEQIFSVDFIENTVKINFKSPLGKLVIYNLLMLDTDWIPEAAMELKKNAYFIYKRFILNRVSGKRKPQEIRLWFEEIKSFLDLKSDHEPVNYKIINEALDDIVEKGFVRGYSWNRYYRSQRQYRLSIKDSTEKIEKHQDKSDELLKVST